MKYSCDYLSFRNGLGIAAAPKFRNIFLSSTCSFSQYSILLSWTYKRQQSACCAGEQEKEAMNMEQIHEATIQQVDTQMQVKTLSLNPP